MLTLADIHLVIQKKGAADSVLSSKLTNILSCGVSILLYKKGRAGIQTNFIN